MNKSKKTQSTAFVSQFENTEAYEDMPPVFGEHIKLKLPKTNRQVSLGTKLKKKESVKYLIKDPKKPFVGDTDELEAVEEHFKIPEELRSQLTQQQYAALVDTTFESCEETYKQIKEQIEKPVSSIKEITGDDNIPFLPYLPERDKFAVLCDMILSDREEMLKELNSIRSLYTKYLDENGKVKKGIPRDDAFILETITDIKLRFFVCGNRVIRLFDPAIRHLSDFFSSMKFGYYLEHPGEAPEDIKKFIETRLHQYTNTQAPERDHTAVLQ